MRAHVLLERTLVGVGLLLLAGGWPSAVHADASRAERRAIVERAVARLEGRVGSFGIVRKPGRPSYFKVRPGMAVADGIGFYRSAREVITREIPSLGGKTIPGTFRKRLVQKGTHVQRTGAQRVSIFISEPWRPRERRWRQLPDRRSFGDTERTSAIYKLLKRDPVPINSMFFREQVASHKYRRISADRAIEVDGFQGRLGWIRHEGIRALQLNHGVGETAPVAENRAVSFEGYVMIETPAITLGVKVKASPAQYTWVQAINEQEFLGLLEAVVGAIKSELPQAEPEAPEPEPEPEAPEPEPEQPQIRTLHLLDANPLFTDGLDVENAGDPAALLQKVRERRIGVCADGVSRVLLRIVVDKPGRLRLTIPNDDGAVRMLFGGKTYEKSNTHYGFALYTPPKTFGKLGAGARLKGTVGTRSVKLSVRYDPEAREARNVEKTFEFKVVRPPVLLVHGTFDNPKSCWETPLPFADTRHGRVSMAQALGRQGFATFLVDFERTNGSPHGQADLSSFQYNRRVLWANPGGIYDALSTYRNELKVAATQVDVVGHSLGGLIPRLWASDRYNPKGPAGKPVFDRTRTQGYRRPDNFKAGDIHRLVTLCSTHMGSDLGHLAHVLETVPKGLWQHMAGLAAAQDRLFYFARLFGYAVTPAVRDQLPHLQSMPNRALQRIGATRVPSHAVVCWGGLQNLSDFGMATDALPRIACWALLNLRPEVAKEFLKTRGQEQALERIFGELISLDGQRSDPSSEVPGSWLTNPTFRLTIRDQAVIFALFRAAIFGNTQNDFVVRVESQAGGLPLNFTTQIGGVQHSFAPHYRSVQRAVVRLLEGPDANFHQRGFPAPAFLRNIEPFAVSQDPAERAAIVAAAGIVPSHAEALSFVAMQQNVVILVRPVNLNATRLIATHNATKDMHVKGKSSSWGPQKGFIPVEQRFSKLHFAKKDRAKEIEKYDGEVKKCLQAGRARQVPLSLSVGGIHCEVLVVEGVKDPEKAIVLRDGAGTYHGWKNGRLATFNATLGPAALETPSGEIERAGTRPFMILADRSSGRPLTADYDLLAFATRVPPKPPLNDPEMGGIRPYQIQLLRAINNEVRLRGNYVGGNVSHHGPEVLFPKSPGADYPITAFEPSGYIVGIREGRRGRSDYWLKRYFHHLKCRDWIIEPNQHTWNWGGHDPEQWPGIGYFPDDRKTTVPDSPDNPHDSDEGDEPR